MNSLFLQLEVEVSAQTTTILPATLNIHPHMEVMAMEPQGAF